MRLKAKGLLSKKRFQVYEILYNSGPLTAAQVSNLWEAKFGKLPNSETIRPRLTELRDRGVAAEKGTKICPIMGNRAILWDVTSNLPTKPIKKKTRREKKEEAKALITKIAGYRPEDSYLKANLREAWRLINSI